MKEEPDLGGSASQQLQRQQSGRHSRTTSATSYDSESDDNMLQPKAAPGGKDSGDDGESLGGSSSASNYYGDDYPDNRYDPSSVGCYPMQQQPQQYNQNYPPPPPPPMYSGPHDDRLSFPTAAGYHPGGPEGPSPGPQEIAMINHAGVSYGHQMPWYGGPPRAYPIPPGHMYNMYHFNR
ncbi:hypothetical protein quinque_004837 [Culex quinquefasciatus]